MAVTTIAEWKKLVGDRKIVGYDILAEATGLTKKTLMNLRAKGDLPAPEARGAWLADRQDLAEWVLRESRPGQGYRSDLKIAPAP